MTVKRNEGGGLAGGRRGRRVKSPEKRLFICPEDFKLEISLNQCLRAQIKKHFETGTAFYDRSPS